MTNCDLTSVNERWDLLSGGPDFPRDLGSEGGMAFLFLVSSFWFLLAFIVAVTWATHF